MVEVRDTGKGIENIKQANDSDVYKQTGAGTFRDGIFFYGSVYWINVHVISEPGEGTRVIMKRALGKKGRHGSHNRFDRKITQWR